MGCPAADASRLTCEPWAVRHRALRALSVTAWHLIRKARPLTRRGSQINRLLEDARPLTRRGSQVNRLLEDARPLTRHGSHVSRGPSGTGPFKLCPCTVLTRAAQIQLRCPAAHASRLTREPWAVRHRALQALSVTA